MKIRSSILWFCAVVVATILLVVWFAKRPTRTRMDMPVPLKAVENVTQTPAQTKSKLPFSTNYVTAPTLAISTNIQRKDKEQETLEILSTKNDVPIVFYGRLEDQFGNPVVGAEIAGSTIIYNGTRTGSERVSTISDANGGFHLEAGKGESLGVMPHKEGYALASTGTFFKYSHLESHPYVPDQINPTVIMMWKLQGAETLASIDQRYKFYYTNAPVNFDLLTGKIVPIGGDIKITVQRSPGLISGRTRQEWGVLVEAVDGGLIESGGQEGVTFEAPESGYQPGDSFVMSTNAPHKWMGGFDQTFFLKSRDGQVYSKVNFGITINQHPEDYVWIEFHGVANTNGSRNWEATVPK